MDKLTPEQVSELKCRELNKKISFKLGLPYTGNEKCRKEKGVYVPLLDYCNNWNDLIPLVDRYQINLNHYPSTSEYHAFSSIEGCAIGVNSNKMGRALAECLYLVLQEKEKAK